MTNSSIITNIYFIREKGTGNIKIGSAVDIDRRLSQLQTGNSSKLEVIDVIEDVYGEVETEIHSRLAKYRLDGEWFSPDVEDKLHLATVGLI